MRAPMLHTALQLHIVHEWWGHPSGRCLPARPLNVNGLPSRIKLAWGVFTGRYDAVDWEDCDG